LKFLNKYKEKQIWTKNENNKNSSNNNNKTVYLRNNRKNTIKCWQKMRRPIFAFTDTFSLFI